MSKIKIRDMTVSEIRAIKYESCKLCERTEICEKMSVKSCRDKILFNSEK